jgi:hypothetical protein
MTNRRNRTFQHQDSTAELHVLEYSLAAKKAGRPPTAKIVPSNGGFELQNPVLLRSGTYEMQRVAWARDRKDVESAARLRNLPIA